MTTPFSIGAVLRRPETGSFLGLATVFIFFTIFGGLNVASVSGAAFWLNVATAFGIIAIPIGLLMIAGELDISIGLLVPAGSMTVAIISGYFQAMGIVAALRAFLGLINGLLVVRKAAPSFIVMLGTLFAVAGLRLGLSVLVTQTTSVPLKAGNEAKWLLGRFIGGLYQVTILWSLGAALVWGFILHFTRYGNWVFTMGRDRISARNAGIQTDRMTILLFMCSGASATFVGVSKAILYNSAQVSARQSCIFNAIISVVVGGC
jgi:simple sugar transport system permease protein